MFEIAQNIEQALKSLFDALGGFAFKLIRMAFTPGVAAQRFLDDPPVPPGPYTFLALTAFRFEKIVRVGLYFLLMIPILLTRDCSGGDSLSDTRADYFKSQIVWPTADDVLLTAIPIILLVLGLSWVFSKIPYLRPGTSPCGTTIASALCYAIGAQCFLVAPIAIAFTIMLAPLADYLDRWWPYVLPGCLMIAWPCLMYFKFLNRIYRAGSDPPISWRRTRIALVVTGLVGVTLPMALVFAIAYPLARADVTKASNASIVRVALLRAIGSNQNERIDADLLLLNNTAGRLLIRGDRIGFESEGAKYYCGGLTGNDKDLIGIALSAGETKELNATFTEVPSLTGNPGAPCGASAGWMSEQGPEFHGRVWLHTFSFDGKDEWIDANLKYGRFPTPEVAK
jgi:hypothetical protein